MKLNKVTNDYYVSDQITIEDVETIKKEGFKTVFCHRPNDEEPSQPAAESIKEIVEENELNFIHQPVIGNMLNMQDVANFIELYESAEKPIFAYCRTGTRSCTLWALSQMGNLEADEIINLTSAAGYNLQHLIK